MDDETLWRMDREADKIIESYCVDPSADIKNYTITIGNRLRGVYGAATNRDLLIEFGKIAEIYMLEKALNHTIPKIGRALKQVYHDSVTGKKPPKPEEFQKILYASSAVTITGSESTLTKDTKS